jgi:linoleoyl-CoA desaturase
MIDIMVITNIQARNFSRELQTEVRDYFKRHKLSKKGNRELYLKTALLLGLFFSTIAVIFIFQPAYYWILYLFLGVLMAGIGMGIMHDGVHGAYSENERINSLMGAVIYLCAGIKRNWNAQHNILHHSHTNIAGKDQDLEAGRIIRFHRFADRFWFHQFQKFYAFFAYSLLTLNWSLTSDILQTIRFSKNPDTKMLYKNMRRVWIELILLKIGLFGFWLGLPVLLGMSFGQAVSGFVLMHLVAGSILAHIFQLAHVHEEVPVFTEKPTADMRMVYQFLTTQNFATRNKFLTWYSGGLNHQIEHHAFPNISHVHLPKIRDIVEQIAEKHGVTYREVLTFWRAISEHYAHIGKLGFSQH